MLMALQLFKNISSCTTAYNMYTAAAVELAREVVSLRRELNELKGA
jgi:hypothetical protein